MLKNKATRTVARIIFMYALLVSAFCAAARADGAVLPRVAEIMTDVTGGEVTAASLSDEYPDFADGELSVENVLYILLNKSGLKADNIGAYPTDYVSFATDLGMISEDCDTTAVCTADVLNGMEEAYSALYGALNREDGKKEPLFLNGMAQPIYEYTADVENDTAVKNEDSSIIRYCVWVETDHDTDADGKLDLVRVFIQIPREAAEGRYKAATLFEASPYSSGQILTSDREDHLGAEGYDTDLLYATAPPRTPAGDAVSTMTAATDTSYASADTAEWYYENIYSSADSREYPYLGRQTYYYYLVRGYAIVECSGLGTYHSEGFNTCGTDVEIDAYKCVVEWLAGKEGRIAYTDRTSNIPVYADWSNGSVAMTGLSYDGTTAFGTATTGAYGLKTIIPLAGIASWYDYSNQQGMSRYSAKVYSSWLSWLVTSRYLENKDWESIFGKYGNYLYQLDVDEQALHGDYGGFWESRNYTRNKDKIACSALIVHGLNDFNVTTKQFDMMYDAFKESGSTVKLILHQGAHSALSAGDCGSYYGNGINGYQFYVNGVPYDTLVNKWLSYYLYNIDNGITDELAEVSVQDSHDASTWKTYDSWSGSGVWTLTAPDISDDERYASFSYDKELPIKTSQSGLTMANGSTYANAAYSVESDEEITIDGTASVTFTASVSQTASDETSEIDENTEMVVTAMIVDAAPSGETFPAFMPEPEDEHNSGANIIAEIYDDLFYVGGGYGNYHHCDYMITDTQYKIITRGYMDLSNPTAGNTDESSGSDTAVSLADGSAHSYTLYLSPTVYRLQAGHRLAIVLCTVDDVTEDEDAADCSYTVNVDNSTVRASIPTDGGDTSAALTYLPKVDYAFDVTADEGGKLSEDSYAPEDNKAEYGTVAKVSAAADEGYSFIGWYDGDGELFSTEQSLTIVVKEDVTLAARFVKDPEVTVYTGGVSFSEDGGEVPVAVTSTLDTTQSGTIIAAVYDKAGALLAAATADEEIQPGETNRFLKIDADLSEAANVKVFLWDGLDTMTPLTRQ